MDGALSSDRYNNPRLASAGGGGYRGGGYRGGGRGRGGGSGRGGRFHHPYRRDDPDGQYGHRGGGGGGGGRGSGGRGGGGGGGYRGGGYRGGGGSNYGGGGGNHGQQRHPANRFTTETKSVSPQNAMMKQLTAMVAKMGDLGGAAEVVLATATTNSNAATTTTTENDATMELDNAANDNNKNSAHDDAFIRPIVKAIGTNVSDLVEVLCGPSNAPLFLKFGADDDNADTGNDENKQDSNDADGTTTDELNQESSSSNKKVINASIEAGSLATLLVSCSSNLPLQTPSYAALTLGVDTKAPKETHSGFAQRCVTLGMRLFGRDLDMALECSTTFEANSQNNNDATENVMNARMMLSEEEQVSLLKSKEDQRNVAECTGGFGNGMQLDAYARSKLLLRYLAHLACVGIVSIDGHDTPSENAGEGEKSLLGLLEMLVEGAIRAAYCVNTTASSGNVVHSRALSRASQLLASLVLSTIPYMLPIIIAQDGRGGKGNTPHRLSEMVESIENNIVGISSGYVSEFDPGCGSSSILLKGELDDALAAGVIDGDDEDEDDEEEDGMEGDMGDQPAPCADTLQDLLRTVRKLIASSTEHSSSFPMTRFALVDDAPWKALTVERGNMSMEALTMETVPMSYEGEPLLLDLVGGEERRCKSIPYLLSMEDGGRGVDGGNENTEIRCRSLDGIVFGRLAIFDAPSNPADDGDHEEEDDKKKETNPNLDSYVNTFSLIDRFFLSDAIRDVLLCHRPMVSEAGAERNTAKEIAEQIWAVSYLFKPPSSSSGNAHAAASKGIEYGIIETLLSLLVQTTPINSSTPSSSPLHSHLYISRILLELTKLQPTLVPQAIALAISGMFQDFIPSLTPSARDNLGTWLGFHLVNTDYQWPRAYWDHWAPYAGSSGRNSRGEFIKVALRSVASVSSEGMVAVVKDCLPSGSALVESVLDNESLEKEISSMEKDLIHRLWNTADDPENIRQYIISDEVSESHAAGANVDNSMYHKSVWWRARLIIRALFHPILRERLRAIRLTRKAWKSCTAADNEGVDPSDVMMDDEVDDTDDLLADITDAITRFKPVVLAALARDADMFDSMSSGKLDDDELLLAGEVSMLEEMRNFVPLWDVSMVNALVECLMNNKIVSCMAVAKWSLADELSTSAGSSCVLTHWWKFVSLAIRCDACSRFDVSRIDLDGGIGMIIDDGQHDEKSSQTVALLLDEALKSTVPILKFVIERACEIVSMCTSDKKVSLECADVADGMKRLLRALLFHIESLVQVTQSSSAGADSVSLATPHVHDGLAGMDADGHKLASICAALVSSCDGEQGKVILLSLARSLEKIL